MDQDDSSGTNEGPPTQAAMDQADDGLPPTTDKRTQTRRQKERKRRRKLIEERNERLRRENLVLAVAATGASFQEISNQLSEDGAIGFSKTQVQRLYASAMDRIEAVGIDEYRRDAMHSLGVLKQAAFREALAGNVSAMNAAERIQDQMNRLQAAYPPDRLDIGADVTVRREVSVREVGSLVARIQAARVLTGEADMPALGPGSTNGHGTGSNGDQSAADVA